MARLVLKFDDRELMEWPLVERPVTIGRAPDNDIHIDNLAVSDHHARIFLDSGALMVEDLNSLNGTFLNNSRVKRESLHPGDAVFVGKHVIVIDQEHDVAPTIGTGPKRAAPKMDETVVMSSSQKLDYVQQVASKPETDRARVPSLIVLKGKTSQVDYLLTGKLTIIGKSPMATVRLRGWFAPQVAAQISQRRDGYYLGLTKRLPKVNGKALKPPIRLNDGDLIEVSGVLLKFTYRD
jgi:pSer/pThr/pTyr-binding forkhead associated (FHA) protein